MRLLSLAGVNRGQISLAIVNDQQMAQLNMRFAQTHGSTDVLSFDLRDETDIDCESVDVEIIVNIDQAERQARSRGHEVRLELLLYALHGLLHVIGYDDHTEPQAKRMHEREDELLQEAGFAPIFHVMGRSVSDHWENVSASGVEKH